MATDASPILRGFQGRGLRQPPLLRGLVLSFHRPLWFLGTILVALAPLPVLLAIGLSGRDALGITGFWMIVANFLSWRIEPLALMKWRMNHILERFAITALRPFHNESTSYLFQALVAPTIGSFGLVHMIADPTLGHRMRKTPIPDVTTILGDTDMATEYADDDWRAGAYSAIAASDLAVIDLTRPSVNLLWEAARCLELLPPHRVLFVKVRGRPWRETMDLVRDYALDQLPAEVSASAEHLSEPIDYGGLLFGTWRFRLSLFLALRRLRSGDHRAAGHWEPWIPEEVRERLEQS